MSYVYTRSGPPGVKVRIGRLNPVVLSAAGWTSAAAPAVLICGPTGFVEAAASLLVKAGHDPGAIKTERFGPSGG
jgi:ferredoxin-NADP reductase